MTDPKDLLKRIEALALEQGAFAIIRNTDQQKTFEKALMCFGLSCFQEAIADSLELVPGGRKSHVVDRHDLTDLNDVADKARLLVR